MREVSIVGLDLAKRVFQVHGTDTNGGVVFRRKLSRGQVLVFFTELPRCIVAMEACATAHHWAREIGKLARPAEIRFADALPKTRSGKIMRRLLRDVAAGKEIIGDVSTLEDKSVLAKLQGRE